MTDARLNRTRRALAAWPSGGARRHLRAAVALGVALMVAGCDPSMLMGQAPTSMAVADGAVVIAGPPGFCVDTNASHQGSKGAFVLLGSCASITDGAQKSRPPIRAVLTAAVSEGAQGGSVAGSERQLTAFFQSAAGRAVLSRSGDSRTVKLLGISHYRGAMVLHIQDVAPFPGQAVQPDYWRALFDLDGHIVTLNVFGVPEVRFSADAGRAVLRVFITRVRAASAEAAAEAAKAQAGAKAGAKAGATSG